MPDSQNTDRLAAGAITLLAFVFFAPVLIDGGRSVVGNEQCDTISMFYPFRDFANAEMRAGRLPLWNPNLLCGHPFHAEGQGAIFYPVNLLLFWLPTSWSLNIFALLHFIAVGVFTYLYLRALGLRPAAAALGAMAFQYSSVPISRLYAGHFTNLPALALTPAFLWAWTRWRRGRGAAWLGAGMLIYGSLILAGHPQFLFYASIYFAWHVAFDLACDLRAGQPRRAGLTAGAFAALVAGGVLIGAAQLAPTYAFVESSFRQMTTYDFAASFSFAPENFITLLAPGFFGDMRDFPYWGRNYLWEMWLYIGIAPLALAVVAIARIGRADALRHTLAVPVFLLLALGGHTPLLRFLFDHVPFFDLFRGNAKFSLFALFSLCALAGAGAGRLLDCSMNERSRRRDLTLLLGALLAFLALGAAAFAVFGAGADNDDGAWRRLIEWRFAQGETYAREFSAANPPPAWDAWTATATWMARMMGWAAAGIVASLLWPRLRRRPRLAGAVLLLLAVPDGFLFAHRSLASSSVEFGRIPETFASIIREDPEHARAYSAAHPPNVFGVQGVETVSGYVGAPLARTNHFFTAVSGFPRETPMPVMQLGGNLPAQLLWPNVQWLIVPEGARLPEELAPIEASTADPGQGWTLNRVASSPPRTYFASAWRVCSNEGEALRLIEGGEVNTLETALIEAARPAILDGIESPAAADRVEITEHTPGRLTLRAESAGPRLLILADALAPGWTCEMENDVALEILPANIGFRAVAVPAGTHEITFAYTPPGYYLGLILSAIGLALGITLFILPRLYASRRSPSP